MEKMYIQQYIYIYVHPTSTGDMMSPFISTATCCGKTERRSLSNFSFSSSISRRAAMQSRVSRNARRCPSSVRLWMNRPTWALSVRKEKKGEHHYQIGRDEDDKIRSNLFPLLDQLGQKRESEN